MYPLKTQENKEAAKFLIEKISKEINRIWKLEVKTKADFNRFEYLKRLVLELETEFSAY